MIKISLYNFNTMIHSTVLALDWNEAYILEDYYTRRGYCVELTKLC